MENLLLDIQRSSQHDGPGVRTTVFLKGCPLHCMWCHNPESLSFKMQLSYNPEKCVSCHKCEKVCTEKVHAFSSDTHTVDYSKCKACGKCTENCPTDALSLYGRKNVLKDIMDVILKDRAFYDRTGGGVTVSGGEPLSSPELTYNIFKECHYQFINTCIETSGFGKEEDIRKILSVTDTVLVDYKVEPEESLKWLGVKNDYQFPFKLLDIATEMGKKVVLRCPIIPEVNAHDTHFEKICELLDKYKCIDHAEILPYHTFGVAKAQFIGNKAVTFTVPEDETVKSWLDWFAQRGINNVIKG